MKSWIGFAVFFLLVAGFQAAPRTQELRVPEPYFEEKVTYHYVIKTNLTVQIEPEYNASNIEFRSYLNISTHVTEGTKLIQLDFYNISAKVLSPMDIPLPTEDIENWLSLPVNCRYVYGVPKECNVVPNDPEWSVNFKKYVLTQLQFTTPEEAIEEKEDDAIAWAVHEDGVGGDCKTRYYYLGEHIDRETPDRRIQKQIYKKIRHYEECKSRVHYQSDNLNEYGHQPNRTGFHQGDRGAPEEAFSISHVLLRFEKEPHPVIDRVHTIGKNVFHSHGKQFSIYMNSNLTLWAITRIIIPSNDKATREIRTLQPVFIEEDVETNTEKGFFDLFSVYSPERIVVSLAEDIVTLAEKVMLGHLDETQDTGNLTLQIVDGVATLTVQQLEQLHEKIKTINSVAKTLATSIYEQIVSQAGSRHAAMYIARLVEGGDLTGDHAVGIVGSVHANIYNSSQELVETYKKLCFEFVGKPEKRLFSALCLTYGKLFRQFVNMTTITVSDQRRTKTSPVHDNPRILHSNTYKKWKSIKKALSKSYDQQKDIKLYAANDVEEIVQRLKKATNYHQRVTYLHVLGAMGIEEILPSIIPFMTGQICLTQRIGEVECNSLRRVAYYVLFGLNFTRPTEAFEIIQRGFRNTSEPDRLRIAAFSPVLFIAIPQPTLLDKIISELESEPSEGVRNYVISMLKEFSKSKLPRMQKMAEYARRALDRLSETKTSMLNSHFIRSDWYDEELELGSIFMGKTSRNRTLGFPAGLYFGSSDMEWQQAVSLFKYGMDSEGLEDLVVILGAAIEKLKLKHGSAWHAYLDQLDMDSIFRDAGDIKIVVLKELFHQHDLHTLSHETLRAALEMAMKACNRPMHFKGHVAKVFLPIVYQKVVPSEVGSPVLMSHRAPVIVSLNYDIELNNEGDQSCVLSGKIHPKVFYSGITTTKIMHQKLQSTAAVEYENSVQISLPVQFSIGFENDKIKHSFRPLSLGETIIVHRQETRSILSAGTYPEFMPIVTLVTRLPEPLKLNGTFQGSHLTGFNFTYTSVGDNINADRPFWMTEHAFKHGVVYAFFETVFAPQHLNNEFNISWNEDDVKGIQGYNVSLTYENDCFNVTPREIEEELKKLFGEQEGLEELAKLSYHHYCLLKLEIDTKSEGRERTSWLTGFKWLYSIDYRHQIVSVNVESDAKWVKDNYPLEIAAQLRYPNVSVSYDQRAYLIMQANWNKGARSVRKLSKMAVSFPNYPEPNTLRCMQSANAQKYDQISCLLSILVESQIHSVNSNISFQNIPEHLMAISRQADMLLKKMLYPHVLQIFREKGEHNKIKVFGTFIETQPDVHTLMVEIQKPEELLLIRNRFDERPQPVFGERLNLLEDVEEEKGVVFVKTRM